MRHTFATFVVCPSNAVAFAAARAAGQEPLPLFLCGPTGSGKTHLLHAIAHEVSGDRVVHVPAPAFVSRLVQAVRCGDLPLFRRWLQTVDAVLLDDFAHAGQPVTTETLVALLGEVAQRRIPVVVTSHLPIPNVSSIHLDAVDVSAGMEIARRAAIARGVVLGESVLHGIVERADGNPRAMQSAITRIAAEFALIA